MENKKRTRSVELIKDVLIAALTLSALWLAVQTPLAAPLRGLLREEGRMTAPGQVQETDRGSGALPMAMVVNLPGGSELPLALPEGAEGARRGLQYDQAACQELFQRVAGPLVETLSSAGAPEQVSRRRCGVPGVVGAALRFGRTRGALAAGGQGPERVRGGRQCDAAARCARVQNVRSGRAQSTHASYSTKCQCMPQGLGEAGN